MLKPIHVIHTDSSLFAFSDAQPFFLSIDTDLCESRSKRMQSFFLPIKSSLFTIQGIVFLNSLSLYFVGLFSHVAKVPRKAIASVDIQEQSQGNPRLCTMYVFFFFFFFVDPRF
jgi:hypothetical protein